MRFPVPGLSLLFGYPYLEAIVKPSTPGLYAFLPVSE